MPKITVLPPHIANKIAAGEVVDRPASVVKELVENAIDARADEITVVISRSGKELIQVVDNGSGISEADVELAFERHATSKISSAEDLDHIHTLGFRGEALPSIASVARLEVKTCPEGSQVATLLKINGGTLELRDKVAFKQGTAIAVKNLFYNTPARRNFLRADTTEFNQILKSLKRFFLAYPEIHFTLIHNGEELYNLPKTALDDRISQVFGKKFYDSLVLVRETLQDITLEGYVCRPDQARGNTANQFIYLNRRSIINRSLAHAVQQGYGNLLERSRYPQYLMFLTIPPQQVDVNVHPTKMEVRFANERAIYHLFLSAVRRAIQSGDITPAFDMKDRGFEKKEVRQHFQQQLSRPPERSPETPLRLQPPPSAPLEPQPEALQMSLDYVPLPQKPPSSPGRTEAEEPGKTSPNLWQVHNRYIFSQIKSGLVIIDQHLAHERILYEQTLRHLDGDRAMPSQQLLFSQSLELPLEDYLIYSDIRKWLQQLGFVINELSGRTVVIEAIPADVKVGQETRILLDILDYYRENQGSKFAAGEKIAAAFACKNAVKAGEKLSPEALNALVDQLFATREPYFSPHGRPVMITLKMDELERKFQR